MSFRQRRISPPAKLVYVASMLGNDQTPLSTSYNTGNEVSHFTSNPPGYTPMEVAICYLILIMLSPNLPIPSKRFERNFLKQIR